MSALLKLTDAQIPNFGFENWQNVGSSMEPVDWNSSNTFDSVGSYFAVTRSTDHYPANVGSYSIRIESKASILPDWNAFGVAWSGNFLDPGKPSFPVTGHPTSFCGYYKFLPQNNDTMYINLVLFDNGSPVVNARVSDTNTVSNWTSFNVPIPSYTSADSAKITLGSYFADNQNYLPHGNSVLYVDNLSFDVLINSAPSINEENTEINIYPNPASDFIHIGNMAENLNKSVLNIYTLMGKLVQNETLSQNSSQIDVSGLSNGIYLMEIISDNRKLQQKLIIQR